MSNFLEQKQVVLIILIYCLYLSINEPYQKEQIILDNLK